MKTSLTVLALCIAPLAAIAQPADQDPRDAWWENLTALCGKAFAGEMTRFARPADDGWLGAPGRTSAQGPSGLTRFDRAALGVSQGIVGFGPCLAGSAVGGELGKPSP